MFAIHVALGALIGVFVLIAPAVVRAQLDAAVFFTARSGMNLRGVIASTDGSAYLTLDRGGTQNAGTVTVRAPDGQVSVLHSFAGPEGAQPVAALRFGQDGALYGTTTAGGQHGHGTIFRLTRAGELSTLHDFTAVEGGPSRAPLLIAADGGLLGVTSGDVWTCDPVGEVCWGGGSITGKLFRLAPDSAFSVLYDGLVAPAGGLMAASSGDLYGVTSTSYGPDGNQISGTVYRLAPDGTFSSSSSRARLFAPFGELVEASDGFAYGRQESSVFRVPLGLDPANFEPQDVGLVPGLRGGPIFGHDGSLYVASNSGFFRVTRGGAVSAIASAERNAPYAMTSDAHGGFFSSSLEHLVQTQPWRVSRLLYQFGYADGFELGTLIVTRSGELYGTTLRSGDHDAGTLFRVDRAAKITPLLSFGWDQGQFSGLLSPLVEASDGAVYAVLDGPTPSLIRVRPSASGAAWEHLHAFTSYLRQGSDPLWDREYLSAGEDGALYGSMELPASGGNTNHRGELYRFDPASGELRVLASIAGLGPVLRAKSGDFFGLRSVFSSDWRAQVQLFRLSAGNELSVLHTFATDPHGHVPASNLAEGPDGTIYGYARGNEDASPIVYRWTNIAGLEIYASLPQNIDALSSTAPPQIAVARSGEVYLTWEADSSWLPHRVTQSRVISPSGEQQDLPELNLGVVTNPDGDGYGITLLEPGVYYGFRVRPL